MKVTEITNDSDLTALRAGDAVLFSGVAYTARDAAHGRIAAAHAKGEPLPFDLDKAAIYYAGPTSVIRQKIAPSRHGFHRNRIDHCAVLLVQGDGFSFRQNDLNRRRIRRFKLQTHPRTDG